MGWNTDLISQQFENKFEEMLRALAEQKTGKQFESMEELCQCYRKGRFDLDWRQFDIDLGMAQNGKKNFTYKHFNETTMGKYLPAWEPEEYKTIDNQINQIVSAKLQQLKYFKTKQDFITFRANIMKQVEITMKLKEKNRLFKKMKDHMRFQITTICKKLIDIDLLKNNTNYIVRGSENYNNVHTKLLNRKMETVQYFSQIDDIANALLASQEQNVSNQEIKNIKQKTNTNNQVVINKTDNLHIRTKNTGSKTIYLVTQSNISKKEIQKNIQ